MLLLKTRRTYHSEHARTHVQNNYNIVHRPRQYQFTVLSNYFHSICYTTNP